jgi:hypothetical protein
MLELTLSYYYVELTMVGLDLRVHTNTLAGYCIPTILGVRGRPDMHTV